MSDLATILDPARSAHASIHGYLYQAYLSVERWLELEKDVVLRCEGDEDLDLLFRDGSGGLSVQVKALTGTVNIRDLVVQETLRRFAISHHRLRAAGDDRTFLFTSTASLRTQRLDERYPVDVLAVWEEAKEDDAVRARVVEVLRAVLPGDEPDAQLRAALAWLEGDEERWADLIRSVEWKLGEPDLDEVRGRIRAKLAKLLPSVPPGLDHRLLGRVLDASIAPEPRHRCLTSADLRKITQKAQSEVTRWLKTPQGRGLVERLDELDHLRGVLFDKPRDLPNSPRPGQLLTAAYEVIPFDETGRTEILDDLARWCAKDQKRLVRLIYGDGGLGKTRLLIEWCRRLAAQGWLTGFLEPSATEDEMACLLQGTLPRLVVIDYAETQLDTVRFLVGRLARAKDGPRVRLVLIARREGDWWRTLQTDSATEDLLESTRPQELRELLPDLEERRKAFRMAAHAFAPYLKEALPSSLAEPGLMEEAFGRPLYLHMAALAAAQGQPVTRAEDALAKTLQRERQYWHKEVHSLNESETARIDLEEALQGCVVILTLLGGLKDEDDTQKLAQRLLLGGGLDRARLLAKLLHRLYAAPASSGRHVGGLEPDLLGEELVWDELRRNGQMLEIALNLADTDGSKHFLTVLTRLAQWPERANQATTWLKKAFETELENLAEPALEVAVTLGDPAGLLLAQAIQEHASLQLATRIMNRCGGEDLWRSVHLREVALHSTQRVYDKLRAQRTPSTGETDTEQPEEELAELNFWLGLRLRDLGRREEALHITQRAVDLYRLLSKQEPDEFGPLLAGSLNSLGIQLGELNRREEAFEVIKEAADLYRILSQQQPDMFLPTVAASLNNLGIQLRHLGRLAEALQATQEASDLYRHLTRKRPESFLPDFAMSLNSLGSRLHELGRYEAALQASQEAVDLFLLLARERPDAFRPHLAASLGNLSRDLAKAGRPEEALAVAENGVRVLAPYFRRHPQAFEEWMVGNIVFYVLRCQEAGRQPDVELLAPLAEALTALKDDPTGALAPPP